MTDSFSGYTTSGLLMLHGGVQQALAIDDNLPDDAEKLYEVRSYPDWRRWSDAIEAELDKRNIKYTKIIW